jgi:transposase
VDDRSGDATRLLGLAGLAVERVALTPVGVKVVQLVTVDPDAARCPDCGQVSTSGKEWTLTRPRDLPVGGTAVLLQWRKRRRRCRTTDCPRESFTEQVPEVRPGADHDPAAGAAGHGGRGRPMPGRGGRDVRGVLADRAACGGRARPA